jgi:hypothetical protein
MTSNFDLKAAGGSHYSKLFGRCVSKSFCLFGNDRPSFTLCQVVEFVDSRGIRALRPKA